MHDRLQHMKETLMCAVEVQLCDLGEVDTKELGEAIDMIKDLEEAIYYCTVTEAMNQSSKEGKWEMRQEHQYRDGGRMYYQDGGQMYDNRRRRADGTFYSEGQQYTDNGSSGGQNYNNGGQSHSGNGSSSGQSYHDNREWRDEREGRSYNSRRMYMEAKEMKKDKTTQLRELEKYMQELSQDITDMIADSSPEERQYLEKKIVALASKINQMK